MAATAEPWTLATLRVDVARHALRDALDVGRVLAEPGLLQLVDGRLHGGAEGVEGALPHAVETLVRIDAHEEPVLPGVADQERADAADPHDRCPPVAPSTAAPSTAAPSTRRAAAERGSVDGRADPSGAPGHPSRIAVADEPATHAQRHGARGDPLPRRVRRDAAGGHHGDVREGSSDLRQVAGTDGGGREELHGAGAGRPGGDRSPWARGHPGSRARRAPRTRPPGPGRSAARR